MRIAVAQINSCLGDFDGNSAKIISYIRSAVEQDIEVLVFPEAALFGYHPFDLLEREELVDSQLKYLKKIEKAVPKGILVLVGCFTRNNSKSGRPYFNSVAVIAHGKKSKFYHKQLLPTGDVFDEARFIEPGDMSRNFFSHKGKKFFVSICEDIWAWPDKNGKSLYKENPLAKLSKNKVDFVINLSASPFSGGKFAKRHELVAKTSKAFGAFVIYANLVGAQDEIIFDGASIVVNKKGEIVARANSFVEELLTFDLSKKTAVISKVQKSNSETQELYQALVLGIRDFCKKNGFEKVHLGLSGGIDSALVAVLAADAVGPRSVRAFALPGPFSSELSYKLAELLSKNLGIHFDELPISDIYQSVLQTIEKQLQIEKFGVLHENLQARIRGMVLMAAGNRFESLLLSTSNKSEAATGYATLYGDMCGGLAPIADLTKNQVYDLVNYCNQERLLIPTEIINRPPTAELRENQKDQDSLPPYEILDKSVDALVTEGRLAKTETDKWLLKTIYRTEFKRWQSPPILKVSSHSFGRGRRWPISKKISE